MNISKKQKQTHRHREQTCGCQGGGDSLLHSTRNYIQYPVINHNGKEYEKEYIPLYLYIEIDR